MKLCEKIKVRLDEIQEMIEANDRKGIEEKIYNVAKFWAALSQEEREFIDCVRWAVENDKPWK